MMLTYDDELFGPVAVQGGILVGDVLWAQTWLGKYERERVAVVETDLDNERVVVQFWDEKQRTFWYCYDGTWRTSDNKYTLIIEEKN